MPASAILVSIPRSGWLRRHRALCGSSPSVRKEVLALLLLGSGFTSSRMQLRTWSSARRSDWVDAARAGGHVDGVEGGLLVHRQVGTQAGGVGEVQLFGERRKAACGRRLRAARDLLDVARLAGQLPNVLVVGCPSCLSCTSCAGRREVASNWAMPARPRSPPRWRQARRPGVWPCRHFGVTPTRSRTWRVSRIFVADVDLQVGSDGGKRCVSKGVRGGMPRLSQFL
jgi:hypothetical protein